MSKIEKTERSTNPLGGSPLNEDLSTPELSRAGAIPLIDRMPTVDPDQSKWMSNKLKSKLADYNDTTAKARDCFEKAEKPIEGKTATQLRKAHESARDAYIDGVLNQAVAIDKFLEAAKLAIDTLSGIEDEAKQAYKAQESVAVKQLHELGLSDTTIIMVLRNELPTVMREAASHLHKYQRLVRSWHDRRLSFKHFQTTARQEKQKVMNG